jgi:TolB-like protein/Flp pilus assembly protein TadD
MSSTAPPDTLSHYRLLEPIGRGGMGEVWLAEDTDLPRRVAVKLLPVHLESDRESVERLLQEARAVASVEHPNVVTIYEAGISKGRAYLVMQRVEGETLEQRLQRGAMPVQDALATGLPIADALAEVHALGIVHRDLKASNVILSARGPKILDFGIASIRGTPGLTQVGYAVGTPDVMAPEQLQGNPADNRSDLWALGVMLYRMLTGRRPFEGATLEQAFASVMHTQPSPPSAHRPEVGSDLDFMVMKLLRKDAAQRYSRAEELVADLKSVIPSSGSGGIRAPGTPSGHAVAAKRTPRLAVLPFEIMSAEADDAFLAEGLVEDLIVDLARVGGLQVAARADVLPYKNRGVPPRTVARELGVEYVVMGSVRRAGNRARISTQLLRATDGHVQWAERFDRTLEDMFEVQSEVSKRIVQALEIALRPEEVEMLESAPTSNAEAYELYVRARVLLDSGEQTQNFAAEELLQQAIRLDPKFARALGALSECYGVRGFRWWNLADEDRALEYADRALALDATLAEPQVARAHVGVMRDDRRMVREAAARIAANNPDDARAIEWATFAMTSGGDAETMLPVLEKALDRFPESVQVASNLHTAYLLLGRAHDAERIGKVALDRFIEHVRRHPEDGYARSLLGVMLARDGRSDEGVAQAERAFTMSPDDRRVRYNLMCTYSVTGRLEKGLNLLRNIDPLRRGGTDWPLRDPDLENLRTHPEFYEVYEKTFKPPSREL